MARPPAKESEKQNRRVVFYLRPDQYDAIAAIAPNGNVNEYCKNLALGIQQAYSSREEGVSDEIVTVPLVVPPYDLSDEDILRGNDSIRLSKDMADELGYREGDILWLADESMMIVEGAENGLLVLLRPLTGRIPPAPRNLTLMRLFDIRGRRGYALGHLRRGDPPSITLPSGASIDVNEYAAIKPLAVVQGTIKAGA